MPADGRWDLTGRLEGYSLMFPFLLKTDFLEGRLPPMLPNHKLSEGVYREKFLSVNT